VLRCRRRHDDRRTGAGLRWSLHSRRSNRQGALLLCRLCLLCLLWLLGLQRPRRRRRQAAALVRGSSRLVLLRLFLQQRLLPLLLGALRRVGLRTRVLTMLRALRLLTMLLHCLHVVQRGRELQRVVTQAWSRIWPLLTRQLRRLLIVVFLLLQALMILLLVLLLLLLQVRLLLLS